MSDGAMIAGLKPYPAMKDSGVPWLGQVPEHWDVRRMKYILRERDTRSREGTEQLLRVSQYTGVTQRKRADGLDEPDSRAESLVGYKCVEPNELVVNIMLAWNGSMGVSSYAGIASPAYCVYRFGPGAQPGYFHHLLRSPSYKARIKSLSTGVVESRLRLYTDDLYRLEALLPPLREQASIVRFLDQVDRRIQGYIRAKQRLIKLLEEQKQAIIDCAVTHGLDPNIRLKPSGVEWLGEVPQHWEVRKLKHLVIPVGGIQMGPFGASLTELQAHDTGFKLFGQENTISGDFRRGTRWLSELQFRELLRYELCHGDLVLTRKGSIGKCRMVPSDAPVGIADSDTIRVRVDDNRVSPLFIVMLLHHASYLQFQLQSVQRGAILGGLNTVTIAQLRIAVPPRSEQDKLLGDIGRATASADQSMVAVEREISLLRELRTRLIAEVVTGRLDVREVAAGLPDEAEPPGPLDETGALTEGDEAAEDVPLDAAPGEAEL